jgi:hypothetical protein
VYVWFGGEFLETCRSNTIRRWILTLLKILISVVIGALLLAGLYALFGDIILPTLEERIQDMFDFAG